MIPITFKIKDRGATPRGFRRAFRAGSKNAWFEAGFEFHATMRDQRFTHRHAAAANYEERKPKYTARKFRQFGHTYPLQFSGRTRRLAATANITSTSNGARVKYPGARVFNFKNQYSNVDMVREFTTVLQREADQLARVYDQTLDALLNQDNETNPGN